MGRGRKKGFGEKIEAVFYRFLFSLFIFVTAVQIAFLFGGMRRFLSGAIRSEGEPVREEVGDLIVHPFLEMTKDNGDYVCFRFLKEPDGRVWVLVNGMPVKEITQEDGCVKVQSGDLLELVCPGDTLVVSKVGETVISPMPGHVVSGSGKIKVGYVCSGG